ncbi:MAG: hypothetical protein AAB638_00690 [Patescibacteria group bacterium]
MKTNKIAQPNTSLTTKTAVTWTCADWLVFHKGLVKWFTEGRFASKVKLAPEAATIKANEVFKGHWDRNASTLLTRCGFGSEFFGYFNTVGLFSIFNLTHRTANAGVEKVSKIADNASTSLVNVLDTAGKVGESAAGAVKGGVDTVSNVAGLAKYIVPVGLGVTGLLVVAYVYKNYIKGDSKIEDLTPAGQLKKLAFK